MLRPPPAEPPLALSLTCGSCGHAFLPDREAFATARVRCPRCAGWSFSAELTTPDVDEPIPFVLADPAPAGEVTGRG